MQATVLGLGVPSAFSPFPVRRARSINEINPGHLNSALGQRKKLHIQNLRQQTEQQREENYKVMWPKQGGNK